MFERILVPVDGSPLALEMMPYVAQIGAALSAQAVVLHVSSASGGDVATADVEGMARKLTRDGVPATAKIIEGRPADVIVQEAQDGDFGLIAMATQGRGGISRLLNGSVTSKVLQAAPVPLLLCRPSGTSEPPPPIRAAVVALDGSQLGEAALTCARDLAGRIPLQLILLRVVPVASVALGGIDPAGYAEKTIEFLEKDARSYLEERKQGLASQGMTVTTETLAGDPAELIASHADSREAMIVMTTHGRTGLSRWAMGSIADRVVRIARGPVLIIPARPA